MPSTDRLTTRPHGGARPGAGRKPTRLDRVRAALAELTSSDGLTRAKPDKVAEASGVDPSRVREILRGILLRGEYFALVEGVGLWARSDLISAQKPDHRLYSSITDIRSTTTTDIRSKASIKNRASGVQAEIKSRSHMLLLDWLEGPSSRATHLLRLSRRRAPSDAEVLRFCWHLRVSNVVAELARILPAACGYGDLICTTAASARAFTSRLADGLTEEEVLDRAAYCLGGERGMKCHTRLARALGRDHEWDGEEVGALDRLAAAADTYEEGEDADTTEVEEVET